MSKAIEAAIRSEKWGKARKLIRAELKRKPDSHWLMTRLSLTYYEEHKYVTSLSYSKKALKIEPRCPLALWDYAGTLQMLGRHRMALGIYRQLLSRGIEGIAHGDCGEGLSWARGLVADCFYRQGHSLRALKQKKAAIKSYGKHLRMRGPGCRSIYKVSAVRKELSELT
jgi:tetratricopeptide (TPR) repeat protein